MLVSERTVIAAQRAAYDRDGYVSPLPLLNAQEVAHYRACYDGFVAAWGEPIPRAGSLHLVFPWAHELASRAMPAVAGLLDPHLSTDDVAIWGTLAFCKYPHSQGFVPWHQDGAYADFLDGVPSFTAWIALTDSSVDNGCMRFSAGTHKTRLPHNHIDAPNNLLKQGHQVEGDHYDSRAIDVVLQPGEMSIHHLDLVHGSNANVSARERLGFIVRYTTAAMLPDDTARLALASRSPRGLITRHDPPKQRSAEDMIRAYREINSKGGS